MFLISVLIWNNTNNISMKLALLQMIIIELVIGYQNKNVKNVQGVSKYKTDKFWKKGKP